MDDFLLVSLPSRVPLLTNRSEGVSGRRQHTSTGRYEMWSNSMDC